MTGINNEGPPLYEVVSLTPQHVGIGTADEIGDVIEQALRNASNLQAGDGVRTALELRQSGRLVAVVLHDGRGDGWYVIDRLLRAGGNPVQGFARTPARVTELVAEIARDDVSHAADIDTTAQEEQNSRTQEPVSSPN